jgi:hypothetical protein
MAGPHQNVPNKSSSGVPLKPLGTAKPGPSAKKRALETTANISASKRAQPAGEGRGGTPSSFLNPFSSHHQKPTAELFDPGMSVAESEELTRRIQQRVCQGSSEGMGEIERAAADDSNAVIDPSLWDTMDSMMAMNGSVSASRVPVSAHSRPVSTMRGPTPDVAAANRAHSVTPAVSTAFQPTARRLGAVPPKPVPPAGRDLSAPFNQFRTPDLPSDRRPGFSTDTAASQRSAATSLSTPRVPSTAFADKLANLNMIVAQLADKFDRLALQSRNSVEFKPQIKELAQENHTLRATVEDHHAAIHELQTTIDAQSASLDELLVLIDELRSSGTALPAVKSVDKATKAMRDNVFNVSAQHFINTCAYYFPECNPAHILTCNGYF